MASVAARAGANVCKPEASTTRVLSRLYTVLPCEHTCDTADRYLGSSVARVASACIFSRERTTDDGRSYRSRECSITRHCELIQTLSTRQDIGLREIVENFEWLSHLHLRWKIITKVL